MKIVEGKLHSLMLLRPPLTGKEVGGEILNFDPAGLTSLPGTRASTTRK